MRALILACAVCSPIVVAYHFITRVPALAFLVVILNLTLGIFAGAMYCRFASQSGRQVAIPLLIAGSVITGIIVTTAQYAVAHEFAPLALFAPFWGGLLGGLGAPAYLALERAIKGREDPEREKRFRQTIEKHAESSADDSD